MKLKLNENEELELVYSFRSSVYFEQITGHNIDFQNFTSQDLITLFYSVVVASLQKAKKPILSMLDFLDVVDNNGGEKCIVDFSNWYIDVMTKEFELLQSTETEKEQKEVNVSKKKKD
jgi:hypothetical protein